MARNNQNKTISCNSNGMIISYGDANKHQFVRYEKTTPSYVKKIQLQGTVKYQQMEKTPKLTPKQNELFSTLLYGFKMFSKEQIKQMPERNKIDIKIKYTKAQRILSRWKQNLTGSFVDGLLLSLFPNSPVVKQMCSVKGYINDVSKEDEISFEDLGVSDEQIVNKFIECKLLPQNFYQLV